MAAACRPFFGYARFSLFISYLLLSIWTYLYTKRKLKHWGIQWKKKEICNFISFLSTTYRIYMYKHFPVYGQLLLAIKAASVHIFFFFFFSIKVIKLPFKWDLNEFCSVNNKGATAIKKKKNPSQKFFTHKLTLDISFLSLVTLLSSGRVANVYIPLGS